MIKNIVFVNNSLGRGGKERQFSLIFSNLADSEFKKYILLKTPPPVNSYLDEYSISENYILYFHGFYSYYKVLKRIKPDVVFAWETEPALYNLILYKILKFQPVNFTIRHGLRLNKIANLLRSYVAKLTPFVIANSSAGLSVNGIKPSPNKTVIYNGIKASLKKMSAEEKAAQRQHLLNRRIGSGVIVFVSIANFVPFKDYISVLDSLAEFRKVKDFYYIIIGDGPRRSEIESKIKSSGLTEKIFMTGRITNVNDYLQISDLLIHSSRGEGCSNSVLEAMFAGLPVIATEVGGTPEILYPDSSATFQYKNTAELTYILNNKLEELLCFVPDKNYYDFLSRFDESAMIKMFKNYFENNLTK